MNYVTQGYEPARVLKIFEDICAIPHGSGNESGVADYVERYAVERGLFVKRDSVGNVFVRAEATEDCKNSPAILLQGHMDMVCEKNLDSSHDFLRDGLALRVIDGMLWASGTTLGADNGIAVAMMLAILDSPRHPTLECLFTVEEETGLAGAQGFDCSCVTAKRMINLDSEEEWQITAGCAGGCRTEISFPYSAVAVPDTVAVNISVKGLSGGHSGAEINCGKTNAIVALARILGALYQSEPFSLVSLSGGGKDNAIAREASACVRVKNEKTALAAVSAEVFGIKKELSLDDGGFVVNVDPVEGEDCGMSLADTGRFISLICSLKTGVLKMSNDIAGLVEYSRNLGIAETEESRIRLTLSSRSSIEAQLDLSCRELDMLSSLAGAQSRHYARYPGWEYAPNSPLREEYTEIYKRLLGKDISVGVIHAGLECGILSSKMSGMDIISIGPDMYDIHSPDEHLDLASCERVWRVLSCLVSG